MPVYTASNSSDIIGSQVVTGGLAVGQTTEVNSGLTVASGGITLSAGTLLAPDIKTTSTSQGLVLTDVASAPSAPGAGLLAFYSRSGTLYYRAGASGAETAVGGGGGASLSVANTWTALQTFTSSPTISTVASSVINTATGASSVTLSTAGTYGYIDANRKSQHTISASNTATIVTDAASISIAGPPTKAGTTANLTLTNTYGIRIDSSASSATNAYGIYANAPSGATNMYAMYANGNVGISNGDIKMTATSGATVGYDNASSLGQSAASGTYTFNHTIGNNSNRLLVFLFNGNESGAVSTVTFPRGGVATQLTQFGVTGTSPVRSMYYLVNPDSGTGTVTVTMSSSSYSEYGTISFYNVDQTTPLANYTTNQGTVASSTKSVTLSSSSQHMVVASVVKWNVTVTPDASQSTRWTATSDGAWAAGGYTATGSTSTTMSYTMTGTSTNSWGIQAATVQNTNTGINTISTTGSALNMSIGNASSWTLPASNTAALDIGTGLLVFDTANQDITTVGKIGINTTSPGAHLDVKGAIRLSGSTSGYVGLSPAATAGSTTYTLPSADGTNGQFLKTNGSGTLSWATAGAGYVGTTATQAASANQALTGITSVAFPSGSYATTLQGSGSASASYTLTLPTSSGTNGYLLSTNGSGVLSWVAPSSDTMAEGSTNLYFTNARARSAISGGTGVSYTSGTGAIAIGQAVGTSDSVSFDQITGTSFLVTAPTSGAVKFQAQNTTGGATLTYTLPNSYGANTQVLTTNGAGALSWATVSGGGGGGGVAVKTYNFIGAISVSTGVVRWYPDAAITTASIMAVVSTPPSAGALALAVKKNGTSVGTVSISSGNYSSSVTSMVVGLTTSDYVTIDVTSANGAADGYLSIMYTRN